MHSSINREFEVYARDFYFICNGQEKFGENLQKNGGGRRRVFQGLRPFYNGKLCETLEEVLIKISHFLMYGMSSMCGICSISININEPPPLILVFGWRQRESLCRGKNEGEQTFHQVNLGGTLLHWDGRLFCCTIKCGRQKHFWTGKSVNKC